MAAGSYWHGILAALLMLGSAALGQPGEAGQAPDTAEAAQFRLNNVAVAIRQVESWLLDNRRQRSAEEAELSNLKVIIDQVAGNIANLEAEVVQLDRSIAALSAQRETLLRTSQAQREQLAVMLRASYQAGTDNRLKLLMTQQDPTRTRRMLVYLEAINRERLDYLQQLQQTLTELDTNAQELAASRERMAARINSLAAERAVLAASESERLSLIATLDTRIAERAGELAQLQQDSANLQALIEEINRIMIEIPAPDELMPFADSRGSMPWPVRGELLARFGERYGGGNLQRQGIVIGAAEGTAVRAIHPGRVVFADWLRGSGNLLIVDHGNGYITLYAHQLALSKSSGDWVNRGEAIGLTGKDAGTGASGIYFEIRRNSQALNPIDWLTAVR